jgi:AraC-like DNA-binding protein
MSFMHDISSKLPPGGRDPLTNMLRGLRLDGVEYGRCRMAEQWGYVFPAQTNARFHFVADKGCWMQTPGKKWIQLKAGDAVLIPRGETHVLASEPQASPSPFPRWECELIGDNVFDFGSNKNQADGSVLFCGSMQFNWASSHPLLRMMPDVMRSHELMLREPAVPFLLETMIAELSLDRIGAAGMLARLADVLAAQIIRSWVEHDCGDSTGWIAAMRDPEIGRVLAAIHAQPDSDWTVETLASLMGASRSSFANRFARIVGDTPARYVVRVRMHQARQWMVRDRMRISDVAHRLGYESEASFSRTFKRIMGSPPSHFRNGSATG